MRAARIATTALAALILLAGCSATASQPASSEPASTPNGVAVPEGRDLDELSAALVDNGDGLYDEESARCGAEAVIADASDAQYAEMIDPPDTPSELSEAEHALYIDAMARCIDAEDIGRVFDRSIESSPFGPHIGPEAAVCVAQGSIDAAGSLREFLSGEWIPADPDEAARMTNERLAECVTAEEAKNVIVASYVATGLEEEQAVCIHRHLAEGRTTKDVFLSAIEEEDEVLALAAGAKCVATG